MWTLKMAEGILMSTELRELLQTVGDQIFLIDCRPFLAYNSGHISSAHNIHCPPIVKRRAGGSLPLENIVRCPDSRAKLIDGHYRFIVTYDENSHSLDHLIVDSNLSLVLKSLRESSAKTNLYFLQGGYDQFTISCPEMCVCSASTESESSEATCEWFTPLTSKTPSNLHSLKLPTSGWGDQYSAEPMSVSSTASSSLQNTLRDTVKYRPSDDQGDPEAILPWLYLGSAYHAMQESRLNTMGINALLNMASKSDTLTPSPSFLHKRVSVEDSCTTDISFWFPEVIDFIESIRQRGGKVLVHCHAGISRSATVCIAYIMWYRHWSMEKAYSYLKSKRSLIAPNLNFMRQLQEFEAQLEDNGKRLKAENSPSSSNSAHSSSSSYMSAFSNCDCTSPGNDENHQHTCKVHSSGQNSSSFDSTIKGPRFVFDSQTHVLKSLGLGGGHSNSLKLVGSPNDRHQDVFVLTSPTGESGTNKSGNSIADFVASIPQPSQTQSLSANLFSTGMLTGSPSHANHHHHPASAKPMFNLPLTPCTRQANVFSFDSPVVSPLTQHKNSPTLTICHSPLVSPS